MSSYHQQESYLVVGGGTPLGAAIVRLLLQRPEVKVSIFEAYPLHPTLAAQFADRVSVFVEDLFAPKAVVDVVRSCEATCIIHTACLTVPEQTRILHPTSPPTDKDWELTLKKIPEMNGRVSTEGTRNLISAAYDAGVKKLVYIGSAECFFTGKERPGLSEEQALYPSKPWLKVMGPRLEGERMVLEANGLNSLATAVIRPATVFGATHYDYYWLKAVQRNHSTLSVCLDNNKALVDYTFVDNAAHAAVLAADRLAPTHPNHHTTAGRAFFVSDASARPFWSFLGALWGAANSCTPPPLTSYSSGSVLRGAWKRDLADKLHPGREDGEHYRKLKLVCATRTYDISRAREVLGYAPIVTHDEGVRRSAEAWLEIQLQLCKNAGQEHNQPPPPYTRSKSTKSTKIDYDVLA
ncbi:hypothetical protein C8R46DRAFT_1030303 [Mycena filopes]|nr:hypothetical protein C8R46DRAFT_1030303 [Mycena filopes]